MIFHRLPPGRTRADCLPLCRSLLGHRRAPEFAPPWSSRTARRLELRRDRLPQCLEALLSAGGPPFRDLL